MAEKRTDPETEQRREDARQAFATPPPEGTPASGIPNDTRSGLESVKGGVVGGIDGLHSVATESVHLVRDVATDTVHAVGDVGTAVVSTAHDLLVDVADGLRDVITRIIPFGAARNRSQPPSEKA